MASLYERQGADMNYEDVVLPTEEPSKIKQFFEGMSVFLTGATGFLGKLMLEKLLRTCTGIEKVYVLIRDKKGKTAGERLEELLDNVLYDPLRRKNPKFADKIIVLTGDCALPNLGINNEDKQKLIDNVSCVFHCAATVRFTEKIRTAAYINVRATMDILALAKQMKKCKSFVHVSTAFSNCVQTKINEEFYQSTITGDNLLKLVEIFDDDMLDKITPLLIGKWPNTYTFTKSVAEDVVKTQSKGLNVAVVRPSIVMTFHPVQQGVVRSLKDVQVEDVCSLNNIDMQIRPNDSDYLWLAAKYVKNFEFQGWNSYMEEFFHDEKYVMSRIIPLSFINHPVSELDTIYTVLKQAKQKRILTGQKHIFLTFDQPLYTKAQQIKAMMNGELDDVIIRLGGFHMLLSFMGCIGKIMEASGLKEVFATVFAPNSVEKILDGHVYSRGVRVINTANEPLAAWIDNFHGVSGLVVGVSLGLVRTIHCNKHAIAEIVPADYVINCTIAAAWDVASINSNIKILNEEDTDNQKQDEGDVLPVYNYVCPPGKLITWGVAIELLERYFEELGSTLQVWHHCFTLNSNYYIHYIFLIFLHRIPAYIVDVIARCIGKEPMMVNGNQKIEEALDVTSYFTTRMWRFQNDNVRALWRKLNVEDRKFFEFNMDTFDWESYSYMYFRGCRTYLLKDPLDTVAQGRAKYRKLQIAHYVLVGLLLLGFFTMSLMIWNAVF